MNSAFTEEQIELMKDVTQPHKVLAKRFGRSMRAVRMYRRDCLGIQLRGFNYDLDVLRDKLDWSQDDVMIARTLKVSPETVAQWKRQLAAPREPRAALTPEQQTEIAASDEKAITLAARYGVTVWTINHIRRKHKATAKVGRPRVSADDFPPTTNWKLPTRQLAKLLGLSWITADRIRSEALVKANCLPTVPIQLELPGIIGDRALPEVVEGIDWSQNISLIVTHLKLDRWEVSRMKSIERQRRRKARIA